MTILLHEVRASGQNITTSHDTIGHAKKAAEASRLASVYWVRDEHCIEGMTQDEWNKLTNTGEYPPLYFQIERT